MGRHARPTRGGNLLSMRSKKQTEWQKLLMESSLAHPRGKEKKQKTQGEEKKERDQTLGYLGVVKPVTPKEDVPLRGGWDELLLILKKVLRVSLSRLSSKEWNGMEVVV
ncbi:hypothetical protein AVEN_235653-1 [Araneus ventricosus]|uniref:Uncharacterized protein n=1 Tax=Araneus ventricosus TaxID=182803 RepID=A0A4Y2BTY5_ARAVE|nr:hypothetical protein AVEN_235653-1 [Araneus ventricosus]